MTARLTIQYLKHLCILGCFIAMIGCVQASESETIRLEGPVLDLDISGQIRFQFLPIEEELPSVRFREDGWRRSADTGATFGYSQKALWLTFKLESDRNREFYLLFDYAILDYIDVYLVRDGWVNHAISGDRIPFEERSLDSRKLVVPFNIQRVDEAEVFVRVVGNSSLTVPLRIQDSKTFHKKNTDQSMFYALVIGAGFAISLLNLFIGILLKSARYLYYVVFTFSFTMANMTLHGFSRYYLWIDLPYFNDLSLLLWGQLGGIGYALFLVNFLQLDKFEPLHHKVAKAHIAIMLLLMVGTVLGLDKYTQIPTHLGNGLFSFYSMCVAYSIWRKQGILAAKLLFLGWCLLMISVLVMVLLVLGFIPYHAAVLHSFDMGMVLNFILISFAMGYQVIEAKKKEQVAREEADEARNLAIVNMEQYRALFEYAPIPMFKIDDQDLFVEANKAFIQLFALKGTHELVAKRITSQSLYASRKDYFQIFSKLSKYGYADSEARFKGGDGETLWLRISVRRMQENGKNLYEGACFDITAQRLQQDHEIARHKREVEQLEALVSGVAHFLNTPLGAATTAQSLITSKVKELDEELSGRTLTENRLKSFIQLLKNSTEVMQNSLTRSIQVIERFRELKPEDGEITANEISIDNLIQHLYLSLDNDIREKVTVDTQGNQHQTFVLPVRQLLMVFNKLTQNAVLHGNATTVNISFIKRDGGLDIQFSDNGRGLSQDIDPKNLFAPFFAKSLTFQEVSGLDLFVVKSVIQNRLGGQISINKSALPQVEFDIQLPNFKI